MRLICGKTNKRIKEKVKKEFLCRFCSGEGIAAGVIFLLEEG
ncbi:MAG: hypothetical protein QW273_01715 [Candidatus Pacearchaeota archaeon]